MCNNEMIFDAYIQEQSFKCEEFKNVCEKKFDDNIKYLDTYHGSQKLGDFFTNYEK